MVNLMNNLNKIKISIIVAVYNVEKYLERCLQSLINQTIKDYEIILIDDGSTDSSGKICDQYSREYTNIIVIHKENSGLSSVRNLGISVSKGEYIGFVDSDDYVEKEMFEELYNIIIKYNAQISIASFYEVRENNIRDKSNHNNESNIFSKNQCIEMFFKEQYPFNYSFACNKLYKKNVFKDSKFNEKIISDQEDTEVMIKLFNNIEKVVYIDKPLYFYCLRDDSLSAGIINSRKVKTERAFFEIYSYTKENIPKFKSQALLKYIIYYFNIIIKIIDNYDKYEKEYYELINNLSKLYFNIIFNIKIPIKYKCHSTLILFNPNLYKWYINKQLKGCNNII